MNDYLPEPWRQDRTPFSRLKLYFEDRSIAEMSIWYCIAAVGSLVAIGLILGCLAGIYEDNKRPNDVALTIGMLGGLAVWFGLAAWLWVSFVRIARGWGAARLGTPIFRYLQLAFFIMGALTMLAHGVFFTEIEIFLLLLLAFDVVIMGMAFTFLLLAWSARCRIPWRTYGEILGMAALLVFEMFWTA